MIVGVDVSSYQAPAYSTAGLSFSIVKATEGTGYINPNYAAQVDCARKGGLVAGHYHYLDGTDAVAEFNHFAAVAKVGPGDIVALDWEATNATAAARDAWLHAAKAHYPHNRVILYCDVSFWDSLDPTHYAADGLWIADYNGGSHPDITQPWVFWQYSSANGMDHSFGNFQSLASLVAWATGLEPAPVSVSHPVEDEDMAVTSNANGRAGLPWAAGTKHVIEVNAAGEPNLRLNIELKFATGPWYAPSVFALVKGSSVYEIPADLVASCRGVILTLAPGSANVEYDVTAA